MNKSTANRNFYYKDSAEGTSVISVEVALKPETESKSCASWPYAEWSVGWRASQNISVGNSGADNSGNQNSLTNATSTDNNTPLADNPAPVSSNSNWPVEPQIFSRIIGPNLAISGADIALRGETVGLDKKPIENVRYLWNFGDGATKEGEAVLHGYNFPGDYVVILDVASGKLSATSRLKIKVSAADVLLGGIVGGPDGKIELINNSSQELDLSWWRIRSGNQFFTLPKNTKVLARGRLPLANSVTGLDANGEDAFLRYPNGAVAYSFLNPTKVGTAETGVSEIQARETAAVSRAVEPISTVSQTAAVAEAVETPSEIQTSPEPAEAGQTRSFFSPWLYGVIGVIILGLGYMFFPKPIEAKNLADEFTIIED